MKSFFFSLILMFAGVSMAQDNAQQRIVALRNTIAATEGKDKLTAYLQLTNIYFVESARDDLKMDTLLALYSEFDAEALRQENYKMQGNIRLNTLGAYMNRKEFDKVIKLAPEYLEYLSKCEVWQQYYAVYQKLLQAQMLKGDYNKSIEGAKQMYEGAKQRGHDDGKGMALYQMSYIYGNMSRIEEEVQYMKESIEILKNEDGMLYLVAQGYFRLCNALTKLQRYDEVLQYAQEFEQVNYRYEEDSKAKQPTTWQNLWKIYLGLYIATKDYDKAETYCYKLEHSNGGPAVQYSVYQARAKIYHARKQYGKALEMAEKALEMCGGDPECINGNLATKIWILCSMRGVDDIHDLFVQAVNIRDTLRNAEFNAQLDELRTVYEVDKITAENKLNRIQKIRNRNNFLFALGGCILLVLTFGIWIYYSRAIMRRNRALFLKIKEQDRLAEELESIIMRYEQSAQPDSENDSDPTSGELYGNLQQQKLVYRLRDYLLQDHRYTQPNIDSDALAAALATNRTTLYKAIKAVTEKPLQEFIQSLRMEEAKRLLESSPELSIDNIIFDCGFSSRSAFYRQFNEQYNISPTAYRKLATNGK